MSQKKLLFIATGGTFASIKTEDGIKPGFNIDQLLERVPDAQKYAEIHGTQLFNIDSTNIHPTHWTEIAYTIQKNYDTYDGFIITHGTDTMHYTSAALSYALQGSTKPVVLTGSVHTFQEPNSDAPVNCLESIRVACNSAIHDICICFHHTILKGTHARKILNEATQVGADRLNVFESINRKPLGHIAELVELNQDTPRQPNTKFSVLAKFNPSVALIKLFPGLEPDILSTASRKRAIVIEGFGPGNIPFAYGDWLREIKRLTQTSVPVIVTTQNPFGETNMERYEVGQKALAAGAIQSYDMTPESALVKLMWIYGNHPDMSPEDVKNLFLKNTCGEILNRKETIQ